jgi:hypothetical protein
LREREDRELLFVAAGASGCNLVRKLSYQLLPKR